MPMKPAGMVQFASVLLRGVIATFLGLLIAGGTLTFAADRAAVQRPSLVPVAPAAPTTLDVPDVTGQAYVFAKGILQDHGFAWHVSGLVQGYAANTVATQQPTPGTTVLDTGAPLIVLTLERNSSYIEKGSPENDSPYTGTTVKLPANVREKPVTTCDASARAGPAFRHPVAPTTPAVTPAAVMAVTTPAVTPVPTPTVAPSTTPRAADFSVPGAPKEPTRSLSLPDRVAALASFVESHRSPTAANLNHWLYEHAYVVAGARLRLVARRRGARSADRRRQAGRGVVGRRRPEPRRRREGAFGGPGEAQVRAALRRIGRQVGGYSLVEALMVMVILGFILAGVTTVFVQGSRAELDVNRRFQAQLQAGLAFDRLRRDIHCATSASVGGTAGSTLTLSGCASGTISWCALSSSTFPAYALYRKVASSCDSVGHLYAGYLTLTGLSRGALFAAPAAASGYRPKVTVDLKVSPPQARSTETYELIDDVVLRNGARA